MKPITILYRAAASIVCAAVLCVVFGIVGIVAGAVVPWLERQE